jgi:hypothetical protein
MYRGYFIYPQSGFCRKNYNGEKVNTKVEWTDDVNATPMPALIT